MADLPDWLKQHGLDSFAGVLRENDVDLDILPDLTDADLERLGLSLGQRRRLLKAAATLAPISTSPQALDAPAAPNAAREAERRQVTVMFCDLVGSTELSARLDPEDMGQLIRRYQDTCAGIIARFDGFVAKLMGDGILVYFGFPQAHEDDAERAVRAALAVVATMGQFTTPEGRRLQARIGIATGLVVVGDIVGTGVAREQSIVGETPNLAARLQALAAPDTVLISQSTRQLIGRWFDVEDAGAHAIKGFAQPVAVWRVRHEAAVASRFAAVRAESRVPFVGREHEIGLLLDRWRLAQAGEGQLVLLVGEAGIGKSRMIDALRERCGGEPLASVSFQGSSYHANTALHPLIRHLELAAGFAFEDPPSRKLEKLEALVGSAGGNTATVVPLFAQLLSLPIEGRYLVPETTPAQRNAATIAAFVDHVRRLAARSPLLFCLEDAHWIDPTTIELMTQLIDAIERAPVLAIVTARPEFATPWSGRPHATSLTLNRLGRAQCAEMVAAVAASAIPATVLDEIVAKTDGVPLFVEELTKSILESVATERTAVPATLQDSLMARLDRLGEAKDIAQTAAAIGREFRLSLLAAVVPVAPAELDRAVARLVDSEIVFPQRQTVEVSYSFKHALMRDAAYESLLRARRQRLHERIGRVLEERFPSVVAEEPEVLAHHFERAGLAGAASDYRERAGDRAAAGSHYTEAVAHFSAALEQLRTLPGGAARARREVSILLKLSTALAILKTPQSAEFADVSRQAYELAQQLGDGPELFRATWQQWFGANMSRRREEAHVRAEELVGLGQRLSDEDLFLEAIHCRWSTALFRGELAVAFNDSLEGVRRYDAERHHGLGPAFGGHDPGVCAHCVQALSLAFGGVGERAQASIEAAIELAEKLGHQHTLAHAYANAVFIFPVIGDRCATERASERLIDIAERCNFPPQRAIGRFFSGWARATGAGLESALDLMEAEVDRAGKLGPMPNYVATLLAEIRLAAGRAAEAFALIEQTLAGITGPDVGFYLPRLLRLREVCLERLGKGAPPASAAAEFARRHEQRVVALRAAAGVAG
jgi:class 3 adenylate cyclase